MNFEKLDLSILISWLARLAHYYPTIVCIILAVLTFLHILVFIYQELRTRSLFCDQIRRFKTPITVWEEGNGLDYGIVDFFFDFLTILFHHKLYKKVFQLSPIYLILLVFLIWLLLIYTLLFIFYLCLLVIRICFTLIKKKEVTLSPPKNFQLRPGIIRFILALLKLPQGWAFLTVYFVFGRRKFNLNNLGPLALSFLLFRPLWYFKLLVLLTNELSRICQSSIFKRKRIYLWPWVFSDLLWESLTSRLFTSGGSLHTLLDGKRLLVGNWSIRANPNLIEYAVAFYRKAQERPYQYSHFLLNKAHESIPHQFVAPTPGLFSGLSFTHSHTIKYFGTLIHTHPLAPYSQKQRFAYMAANPELFDPDYKYLKAFFTNHRLDSYAAFSTFANRLQLLSIVHQEQELIYQERKQIHIFQLNQRHPIARIYSAKATTLPQWEEHVRRLNSIKEHDIELTELSDQILTFSPAELKKFMRELTRELMLGDTTYNSAIKNDWLYILEHPDKFYFY